MNKNGMNLIELAQEIVRRAEAKRDLVAQTSDLVFGDNSLVIGNAGAYPLTDHAQGQIADRVGIPKRYYDRMKAEAPALLADNVNHWFQETPERRMVRTLIASIAACELGVASPTLGLFSEPPLNGL